MALICIDDLDDARLQPYRGLPQANLTRYSGRFVVESRRMVERLAASAYPLDSVLVDARRVHELPSAVPAEAPVYVVPAGAVERIIGFHFHRGMLACGRRRSAAPLAAVLPPGSEPSTILVCIDVHDPTNLGGILRNAAAFGADAVIVHHRCADVFSRRVLRVSMGAAFQLPLVECQDLQSLFNALRSEHGYHLLAMVLDAQAEPLESARRSSRQALVIGNEGHGLEPFWVAQCDRRVTLPMSPRTDSLNAAVASGVFLYHFTRIATCDRPTSP
jgi:tRNA G18 (ribose-2'-O)-methylase SpoU